MSPENITPPGDMVFEIPSGNEEEWCPMQCQHCLQRNVRPAKYPRLNSDHIIDLITQGRRLGATSLTIYPHQGDISLEEPQKMRHYTGLAREIGFRVKTLTCGINPHGVELILPNVSKLAVSVDALDQATYCQLRTAENYRGMLETLDLLKATKRDRTDLALTALVMVDRQTFGTIERRVADIAALEIFDKVKILEMLPIGGAAHLKSRALNHKTFFEKLVNLRTTYAPTGLHIGLSIWLIKNGVRGCRLGSKYLVIGPHGELAGCALLFYLNNYVANVHDISLSEAWHRSFEVFRHRQYRSVSPQCFTCPFYQADLCWGGCLARSQIFGPEAEIRRSCGLERPEQQHAAYERFLRFSERTTGTFFSNTQ
jgi:radical SAM protein with 4Fe4S-binding SPASM domain